LPARLIYDFILCFYLPTSRSRNKRDRLLYPAVYKFIYPHVVSITIVCHGVAITIVVTKTETMVSQLATWPVHRSCPTGTSERYCTFVTNAIPTCLGV